MKRHPSELHTYTQIHTPRRRMSNRKNGSRWREGRERHCARESLENFCRFFPFRNKKKKKMRLLILTFAVDMRCICVYCVVDLKATLLKLFFVFK